MQETVLAHAALILPDRIQKGHLVIRDGQISEISEGSAPRGAIDCGGDYIAPGLVELHTDNLERHITPRPSVDWPHASAILAHDAELAGCGITTVFDAMRVGSIPARKDYSPYARSLAAELLALIADNALRISHSLHLRAEICSETLLEEMGQFGPADRVRLVSLMDHTPGQRQFRDTAALETYLRGKVHMNDKDIQSYFAELHDISRRNGERHKTGAVALAAQLGAVLASHDDSTPDEVSDSAGHGIRLAEFPTTLEAAEACKKNGIRVIMGAPNLIRGGSHSGNVRASDLAGAGLLDIVSSDYVPSALLSAALLLARIWDDLPRAIACVTGTPAQAVGMTDRGSIAPGLRADLIRFRMIGETPALRETWVRGQRVA
ncbi:alpha-D-ribose 1-methylphosphonate 5-triphosphate diphosphatase [Paracoccus aerodenitrificans]|uniref:alpha-D-ribose 1-methylphosphonate 5-triphosphate diphosphatase n=1 Tax=Paracoccus aerodenitrificans TaxID=3017781 RepID=UPI0022F0DC65|nr:alpha-D-ribose 1-methylphosphonate 5-triphosphate diphosphatase [Paracoccus aerodenitrificans]WBU63421.1 alpha-D-ribose 1-methylphosphonate 5-triphosphate diphosphatase [Paracoccus aerodenitrificans]